MEEYYANISDFGNTATENVDTSNESTAINNLGNHRPISESRSIPSSSSGISNSQQLTRSRLPRESSVSNETFDSLLSDLRTWMSRENLIIPNFEEEPEYPRINLTAETTREQLYEKHIDEYKQVIKALKSQLKEEKEKNNGSSSSNYDEAKKTIADLRTQVIEGGNMIKKLKIEITEKDKKIEDCKTQMKKSVTALKLQQTKIAAIIEENKKWEKIVCEVEYKKLNTNYYEAYFRKNGDDFGFEYSIKDGRLFLNESNIVIEGIKTNYLDSSSEHIRAGDFIMAVGKYDVTSLTEDKFKDLLQNNFRNVDKVKLTLRQVRKDNFRDCEVKLADILKKHKMKVSDLPFAMVFCKDGSQRLPEDFPMKNYDIIHQMNNQPTKAWIANKIKGGSTIVVRRYFDTEEIESQAEFSESFYGSFSSRSDVPDNSHYDVPDTNPYQNPRPDSNTVYTYSVPYN